MIVSGNTSDDMCFAPPGLRCVDNYFVQPVDLHAATALSYGATRYSSFRIYQGKLLEEKQAQVLAVRCTAKDFGL